MPNKRYYSTEFKKTAVEKLLRRGSRPIKAILTEMGITGPTLYRWKLELGYKGDMEKKEMRPQDRTPRERLNLLLAFRESPIEKRGEFLRKEGLHTEHIEAWQKEIEEKVEHNFQAMTRSEKAESTRKIKQLEKEIAKKDKALAEAAVLLVLKKKANRIWGINEDNE